MTVLYVDDDSDDRDIFGTVIHSINPGVIYREFEAGEKIIKFLGEKKIEPDFIFIDINMPRMNGYECAQEIISAYGLERSTIVMYSTAFNPRDIERFSKMGLHMLQKASSFEQLSQNLKTLMAAAESPSVASSREE